MKWLTFDRAWTLAMALLAVGGWAAVTSKSSRDQEQQFTSMRATVATLSDEIKSLAGADSAKTLELARFNFRLDSLESKNKTQDDLLDLHRMQLETINVKLAVEAARRGN